jgi:YesN/AraC family two-component response regulator
MVDLQMPEVSGMDIVRAIKEQQVDTHDVFITGFATTDSAIDALNLGVYGYIRKPYRLEEISTIVSHATKEQYLRRENIALTANIQKLLSYVTTLYEISSILYQVSDSEMVLNMILDTITEGMKIPKAALFIHDELYNKFRIIKAIGVTQQFTQE